MLEVKNLNFGYDELLFENLDFILKKGITTLIGPNSCGKTTFAKILTNKIKTNSVNIDSNYAFCYNNLNAKQISKMLKKIDKSLLLKFNINNINSENKQIINVLYNINKKTNVLIMDDALNLVKDKSKIFNYLKKQKIDILNITSDSNDLLYGDYIAILNNKKIIAYDKTLKVLKQEKLLRENNIEIPFMIDLSNKLMFYNLLDKQIIDMDKMVNQIWK